MPAQVKRRKPSVAVSILNAQQILITGAAGTGKTTLAHKITQWRQRQFRGARRTIFDPTFSWNQHIWLQSVSSSELHQEQFVAGGGGQFHARFWDAFKALESSHQDGLHTLVFDEISQWPSLGFTHEELSSIASFTFHTGGNHIASIVITQSIAFSALQALCGATFLSQTRLQNAAVLELLPRQNGQGPNALSVSALYSPEGSLAKNEIALAELKLDSML
ncbi:MAG: ATP-binding protein [Cyanobacteria bacterium J06626_18]